MPQLVIEYVFEGHQRGYNFTSSTQGYRDEDLKTIWRSAMPRGQGWGEYVGARSLKAFPLDQAVVVAETEVTDQRDEHGRGGIRRTVIDLMSQNEYWVYLQARLRMLPGHVQAHLERLPSFSQRLAINSKIMPQPRRRHQLVLLAAYGGPEQWQLLEGLVVKLALSPIGPMRRWGRVIPLTTLALSAHDESALVALPAAKAGQIDKKMAVIEI
jgi:hypothetical protein